MDGRRRGATRSGCLFSDLRHLRISTRPSAGERSFGGRGLGLLRDPSRRTHHCKVAQLNMKSQRWERSGRTGRLCSWGWRFRFSRKWPAQWFVRLVFHRCRTPVGVGVGMFDAAVHIPINHERLSCFGGRKSESERRTLSLGPNLRTTSTVLR